MRFFKGSWLKRALVVVAALVFVAAGKPEIWAAATVTTSTGLAKAQLDRLFNGGSGTNFDSGLLQIWSGSAPGAKNAPTGTKLWEETLPADAFAAAVASTKTIAGSGTWQANAVAAGTAGYWRLVKSGDAGTTNDTDERLEGDITATGGGGSMTVDNTSIANGQSLTINQKDIIHG